MTDAQSLRLGRRRFLAAAGLAAAAVALDACAGPAPDVTPAGLPTGSMGSSPVPGTTASPGGSAPPGSMPPPGSPVQPAVTRRRDNPITAENARRGDPAWDDSRVGGAEAYLGVPSVGPGERLRLRASGSGTVDVGWYRLGWYGGAGARLLRTDWGVSLIGQRAATIDPQTGLVEAHWSSVLQAPAPSGVPSGMLLAVVRARDGSVLANVPVVLRPDPSVVARAPVLFVSAAATWQAYNEWGGLSLYRNTSGIQVSLTGGRRAAIVSFDRPYGQDGGAMYLRRWELQFIRWMERQGRDVDYVADMDFERNPGLVDGRRLIVMSGHPEYWSRPMRERLEAAVAAGTNIAFLTANEVYWQVRLEDGPAGPGSRVVCYKDARIDPVAKASPLLATCHWRDPPVSEPEAPLVGQMYEEVVDRSSDWIVREPGHWLYEGTAFAAGDAITNLVGQEFDTFYPDLAQPGTVLLARGPVHAAVMRPRLPGARPILPIHTATAYTAQSGATVVAAGTFQWSWAIDDYGNRSYHGVATPLDSRVARMTRNLFDRLGDGRLTP